MAFQSPAMKRVKEEKGHMKERSHNLANLKTVSGQVHRAKQVLLTEMFSPIQHFLQIPFQHFIKGPLSFTHEI